MLAGIFRFWLIIVITGISKQVIIPDDDTIILHAVPDVWQSTGYSCGAACLQAILHYWGIDIQEITLMQLLHCSPESGTYPEDIVSIALSLGLDASLSQDLTIEDLRRSVEAGEPVIIIAQAWNGYEENGIWVSVSPPDWEGTWENGHYMVVIGVDSRNVYLEDPSLYGTRGAIQIEEFISRWHDCRKGSNPEEPRTRYHHPGIFLRGEKPAVYPEYTRVQ